MKMKKIFKRFLYGMIGAFLGFISGGILAYLIALLITPKEQDATFAFVFIFALITSQLGMIIGPYLTIGIIERRKTHSEQEHWTHTEKARKLSKKRLNN
jgi:MFS family permease